MNAAFKLLAAAMWIPERASTFHSYEINKGTAGGPDCIVAK